MPTSFPKYLGRTLYWVGVPLQVMVLARHSNLSLALWFPSVVTLTILFLGLGLSLVSLQSLKSLKYLSAFSIDRLMRRTSNRQVAEFRFGGKLLDLQLKLASFSRFCQRIWPPHRSGQGSFVLASMLGNTGFVGLAIAPSFVSKTYLGWVVVYGVANNLLGSYGLGVILASHFGQTQDRQNWSSKLRALLSVPTLWAFCIGCISRPIRFAQFIELGLNHLLWAVIPGSFLLIGMQLSRLKGGVKGLQAAALPAAIKMLAIPCLAGIGLTLLGVSGDARLALVLMAGMPTAFANLILAEEYDLDRQLAAGSILISTLGLPIAIPLWVKLFG
ncbi:AEC family transporter [Altericista sp. CCNU0014]|uniref:AEC family transporter n=1 Tax=Altericista sp. CCNU0014 TaxID=3082949 RepID=UPI00384BD541